MKVPLWFLVVLLSCLCSPGLSSDCQEECVACRVLMQQQHMQQTFNTMVCLLECEGLVSSSFTWQVCKRVLNLQHPVLPEGGAVFKRTAEELQLDHLDLDHLDLDHLDLDHLDQDHLDQDHLDQDLDLDSDSDVLEQEDEEEERPTREEVGGAEEGVSEGMSEGVSEGVSFSKRFGGFQRGRHGYRKLIGSPGRPLQKRYGGFIGVRKSARKWNSQKRVNQLLRQYLGMRGSRSGRGNNNSPVTRVWRQNRL